MEETSRKKRRGSVPFAERIGALDTQIARHERIVKELQQRRQELLAEQKARAEALLHEIEQAGH
jgi:hypothetical protein